MTQHKTVLRALESLQATGNFHPDPVRSPAGESEELSSHLSHTLHLKIELVLMKGCGPEGDISAQWWSSSSELGCVLLIPVFYQNSAHEGSCSLRLHLTAADPCCYPLLGYRPRSGHVKGLCLFSFLVLIYT